MSHTALKPIGIVLLAIGVMISSGAGVQFGGEEYEAAIAKGRIATVESADDKVPVVEDRLSGWRQQHLLQLLLGLGLIIGGGFLARRSDQVQRQNILSGEDSTARDWQSDLKKIESEVAKSYDLLIQSEPDLNTARERLEKLQAEVLEPLINGRMELQIRFGLSGFAQVMGPLSGAERFINRSWTVLVDNHKDAAIESLEAARAAINEATNEYEQLQSAQ